MPLAALEKDGDWNHKPIPSSVPLRAVPASRLIAANVYISEGRDKAVIDRLVRVLGGWKGQGRSDEADINSFDFVSSSATPASTSTSTSSSRPPAAALVHVFVDEPYNRTGFTITGLSCEEEEEEEENTDGGEETARRDGGKGSTSSPPSSSSPLSSVPAAISLLASESLKLIDWRLAGGTHPAIGVVDHVAVHALFPAARGAQQGAARAARRVARALGELGVPTYLYGSASVKEEEEEDAAASSSSSSPSSSSSQQQQQQQQWRKLAEVRRALGYFSTSAAAASPSSSFFARFPDPLPTPDSGPPRAEASRGAAAVGSVPWVMNVNVPLVFEGEEGGEASLSSLAAFSAAAAAVARAVSARRGTPAAQGGFALPGVEALALAHRPGVVEVACNLTDGGVRTEEVARAVELAARRAGLQTGRKAKKRSEKKEKSGADEDDDEDDEDDSSWYVTGKRPEEVAAEAAAALGLEIVK